MAVTGRGTQDDPYIVHDYYELKETFPKQAKNEQGEYMGYGNPCYIELVSDINCNDYAVDFVWEGLYTPSGYYEEASHTYLDLKGHTIKNLSIQQGKFFAKLNRGGITISNGRILNVFGAGAEGFCDVTKLENLTLSMNMTGQKPAANIIRSTDIYRCSIYCICKTPTQAFLSANTVNLCDIYMDVNNTGVWMGTSNNSRRISSRFRGFFYGNSTSGNKTWTQGDSIDCVYNLDFTHPPIASGGAPQVAIGYYSNTSTGNAENYELSRPASHVSNSRVLYVDSAQMKDAGYLTDNGFFVFEITE